MLRLYIDEDSMAHPVLHALRGRGIDVLSTAEAGMRGSPDPEQLAFAVEHGRALVTRNAGPFAALHNRYLSEGRPHAGIVVLSARRLAPGQYADALARLDAELTPEEMANRLEYLNRWL